jgi:hypothetical protein
MKEAIENKYQMGAFKEAEEVLIKYYKNESKGWPKVFAEGFAHAIDFIFMQSQKEAIRNKAWKVIPSPDTPYKIALTDWIEDKVCNTQEIWDKK